MRKSLLIFFLVFFLACEDSKKPQDLISEDKMVEVLTDLHIAEGAMRTYYLSNDSMKHYAKAYYNTVCEKHGVTYKQYRASYMYYAGEQGKMEEIMDKVLENLSKKESGIEAK